MAKVKYYAKEITYVILENKSNLKCIIEKQCLGICYREGDCLLL